MPNLNPTPATSVRVGRLIPGGPDPTPVAESPDMATGSTGGIVIDAILNDPNTSDRVRMMVRLSPDSKFASFDDRYSAFVNSGDRAEIRYHGLKQNTHYYARVYVRDEHGAWARQASPPKEKSYTSVNFWMNRRPNAPVLVAPVENAVISTSVTVGFDWTVTDPDPGDAQVAYQLRWRVAPTATSPPGKWVTVADTTVTTNRTQAAGTFIGGRDYEWQVRVNDGKMWGEWSAANSFYSRGASAPPVLLEPIKDIAVVLDGDVRLRWRFVKATPADVQIKADVRYRLVGQDDPDWINVLGAIGPGIPAAAKFWDLSVFTPGFNYEWQVRTYGSVSGLASDWSLSGTFWAIAPPGQAAGPTAEPSDGVQGSLGCGTYRVFVYDQGGTVVRGEIEPLASLVFSRKRDDISSCLLDTNGFSSDCCDLLSSLRSWAHELVIFRDGVRVWEGPITRITYSTASVEVEAKDCMGYLYRRIMRQGFNDSFQMVNPTTGLPVTSGGTQLGLHTVVERAAIIAQNALAPYDPNLLPYLTAYTFDDDARQSRVVADYSQTAWEQIDDLAANAGLDYTTIGRRIMLWDTHRAIGRLPEMRDGDFDSPPIVTEYGMQMSNYSAVTNGSGIWGAATPEALEGQDPFQFFGPVEILNSAFNESSTVNTDQLTPAGRAALIRTLESQAQRNINHRWPPPVVVRVPDNSTLNPNIGITFDQLVPGVWIPLRATGTCREVSQWQKLDSVTVTETESGERITVVMSPAPNGGEDPDSGQTENIEGGGLDT